MTNPHFGYAEEKFNSARYGLMLPHPGGEAQSIADAFFECSLGLQDLDPEKLDDDARDWVSRLENLMDTSGVEDADGRGRWLIKAEQLTQDDKFELSRVVDELAHWFSYAEDR